MALISLPGSLSAWKQLLSWLKSKKISKEKNSMKYFIGAFGMMSLISSSFVFPEGPGTLFTWNSSLAVMLFTASVVTSCLI